MVYKFFDKKISDARKGTGINSDLGSENKELEKELHKTMIRKYEKGTFIFCRQYLGC